MKEHKVTKHRATDVLEISAADSADSRVPEPVDEKPPPAYVGFVDRYLRGPFFLYAICGVALVWLFIGPLAMLTVGTFRSSPLARNQEWTSSGPARVFGDAQFLTTLGATVQYALAVTVLTTVMAIFFATVSTQLDVPLRRWITPAMVALLAMPTVLYALAWSMLGAGPSSLIGKVFGFLSLTQLQNSVDTRSWIGMVLVTSFKAVPLGYLIILGAFRNQDASLVEASRVAGASRIRSFVQIQIPALAPAILAAALFLFIRGVEAFDIPAVLGMPAGIQVYSTMIYTYLRGGFEADYPAAATASLVIVLIVALLVLAQARSVGRRSYATVGGRARRARLERPGRTVRIGVAALIGCYLLVTIAAPIVQIVLSAFQPYLGSPDFTLANFDTLLSDARVRQALVNTLVVSVVGGLLTVALALLVAYSFVRMSGRSATAIRLASWIPAAMPGIVLSLAFLWLILMTPGIRSTYGTLIPLILGLGVATVPLAVRTLEGPLSQIGKELEEAATISGASKFRAIMSVTVRLLSPSLVAAWLLVSINMSGVLDVPILLSGAGTEMVAPLSFSYHNSGSTGLSSTLYVLYTLLLSAFMAAMFLVTWAFRSLWGRRDRRDTHLADHSDLATKEVL